MAQKDLTAFSIKNFKGMRNWESPQNIPSNYLFYAQNSEIIGGRWQSKRGVSAYLTPIAGAFTYRALIYYPHRTGTILTNYLFAYFNTDWYAIDTTGTIRLAIADTWVVDEPASGVVFNNELYLVSPNNGMAWLNGLVWSTTFTGTPPPGSVIEVNSGKMWVAGVTGFDSIIYFSRTAGGSTPTFIRDWTTGAGSILVGEGGYITALKNLKDTLYVFKNNSIHFLSGFSDDPVPFPIFKPFSVTAGAINKDCVVLAENDLWFFTSNFEIRTLGNAENYISDPRTRDISLAIKRSLQELDFDQSGATMSYFKKKLKLSLRTAGSPSNNWTLEYDFNDGSFQITRLASQKYFANNTTQLFFTVDGTGGQLYQDDSGFTNDGVPFTWGGRTVMWDMGRADMIKRIRYLHFYVGRSINHTILVRLFKDTYDDPSPTTYTLFAPTATEISAVSIIFGDDGVWGAAPWGSSVWGGSGLNVNPEGLPPLYFRGFKIDVDQSARMFGVELLSTIDGGLVDIEQIVFEGIVLPQKYKYVDI